MPPGKRHEWTRWSEDDEKQLVRAKLFGKKWTIQTKLRGDESWGDPGELTLDDLIELHEVLARKYQRGQIAYEHLTGVEKLIRNRGGTVPRYDD